MSVQATIEKKPMNRREFLNFAWLVSIGFFTFTTAGVSYLFALPRFREGEFGGDFPIGRVGDLPATGAPPDNFPKVKLWLSNTDRGLLALYKVCTHLGCLYNWNTQEVKFICPCHGSQFEKDGTYIKGPAPRNLDRFVISIQSPDGQVLAETNAESGEPLPLPDNPDARIVVSTGRRIQGERHA
jgi:cytochrome b6-f complex iron-sulfur subunit